MNWISRFFSRIKSARRDSEPDRELALRISGCLGQAAHKFVKDHANVLVANRISYFVPAIWGEGPLGLDPVQEEMSHKLQPVIDECFELFEMDKLSAERAFALQYMVRGFLVWHIGFMIQGIKLSAASPKKKPSLKAFDQSGCPGFLN